MYDFKSLSHPGIQTLAPYIPGKSAEALAKEQGLTDIIKLASNENPLGCSPHVLTALASLKPHQLATYHVSQQDPLREKLANKLNIEPAMLAFGNGSDALFQALMIGFALHTGRHILTHELAFMTYGIQAKTLGIDIRYTPIHPNWQVDIDALIKACTKQTALIFLANPNNPTGLLIPPKDIKRLLDHIPSSTLLVLDEAYHEYLPVERQSKPHEWLAAYPNLVITRTFSKGYGLAALRLGYAMSHPAITSIIYQIQLPFTINLAAMIAAIAALNDTEFVQKSYHLNQTEYAFLQQQLQTTTTTPHPSAGNFITFHCKQAASIIDQKLQQQGIIVRPLTPYGLDHHLRVTVGTRAHNSRFLEALKKI